MSTRPSGSIVTMASSGLKLHGCIIQPRTRPGSGILGLGNSNGMTRVGGVAERPRRSGSKRASGVSQGSAPTATAAKSVGLAPRRSNAATTEAGRRTHDDVSRPGVPTEIVLQRRQDTGVVRHTQHATATQHQSSSHAPRSFAREPIRTVAAHLCHHRRSPSAGPDDDEQPLCSGSRSGRTVPTVGRPIASAWSTASASTWRTSARPVTTNMRLSCLVGRRSVRRPRVRSSSWWALHSTPRPCESQNAKPERSTTTAPKT